MNQEQRMRNRVVMMKKYAPFALRIGIGGLFLTAGIMKLVNPSMVTGMLDNFGFPGASGWAWLLILVELICGAAVLVGFKLKWVAPPLALVLVVASVLVASGGNVMSALTNMAVLGGVVSLWLSGPGALALSKR